MTKTFFLELVKEKTGEYHTIDEYPTLEDAEYARLKWYDPNYPNGADLIIN